ncbi:ribosomal-processing cysteine protease Prp [Lacrimispora sp. JR3]|uniref:ribosomal-processing cysteine protease Prp n=1 Tax=Lacrimispora sinapis TaxID=3111456 RepID=UPI00374916E9
MIRVTVFVDSEQNYTGIQMVGHAGLADDPQDGQELVCAAVSALTFNMSNSVEQFTEDSFEVDQEEKTGAFHFRFTSSISSESRLLMNSLIFGLQDIEEEYGEPYIKIRFKEV